MEIAALILCFLLLIVGFLGVILPFLPGIPLAWAGVFLYGLATGFEKLSLTTVMVFLGLTLLSLLVDFIAPMLGAGKYKASKLGILGVFVGSIVGIFAFGFWGVILGPLIGAVAGELLACRDPRQALFTGVGTMVGCIFGSFFKLVLIMVMAGFVIISLF